MTAAASEPSALPPEVPAIALARAWGAVLVLFLLSAVAWMDRQVISMLIAPIKAHFGIDDATIGLIAGLAFSAFYVLFLIPIGWLADRKSPRVILFCGVVVWSVATVAFGLAPTLAVLIAARSCVGAGEGTISPIAAATIGRLFGRARLAAPMSVFSLGAAVGSALGGIIAGQILAHDPGGVVVPLIGRLEAWQFVYVVLGAPGPLAALLAFLLPATRRAVARAVPVPGEGAAPAVGGGSVAFIRRNPVAFGCTIVGFVLVNTAVTSILTWTPEHLRRAFAMKPATIGGYIAVIALAAPLIVQLPIGALVNRLLKRGVTAAPFRVMQLLLIAAIPFAILYEAASSPNLCALATFGMLALLFPANPLGLTSVQLVVPEHLRSGLASIYLAVLGLVGVALGSSLVAWIEKYAATGSDLGAAIALAVGSCIAAAAITLEVARRAVRRMADDGTIRQTPL